MAVDILAKALHQIASAQKELAVGALMSPTQRDAFEYGRVSGMYAGLEQAREIMLRILKESTEVIEHGSDSREDARAVSFVD